MGSLFWKKKFENWWPVIGTLTHSSPHFFRWSIAKGNGNGKVMQVQGEFFILPTFVLAITFNPKVQSQQIIFYLKEKMLGNRFIWKFYKNDFVLTRKLNFKKQWKIRFFGTNFIVCYFKMLYTAQEKFNLCCDSQKATKTTLHMQLEYEGS
jgi:hypothetical protein